MLFHLIQRIKHTLVELGFKFFNSILRLDIQLTYSIEYLRIRVSFKIAPHSYKFLSHRPARTWYFSAHVLVLTIFQRPSKGKHCAVQYTKKTILLARVILK